MAHHRSCHKNYGQGLVDSTVQKFLSYSFSTNAPCKIWLLLIDCTHTCRKSQNLGDAAWDDGTPDPVGWERNRHPSPQVLPKRYTSVLTEIRRKKLWPSRRLWRSHNVIWADRDWSATCDFLLEIHSLGPIFRTFQRKWRFCGWNSQMIPHRVHLTFTLSVQWQCGSIENYCDVPTRRPFV